MKRWQKVLLTLGIIFAIWLWSATQLSFNYWISIPIGALTAVTIYAAISILSSISKIKSYPQERINLDA
jgi:hypothetical protein